MTTQTSRSSSALRPHALVVGAGPVGCLAAHSLASLGYTVDLVEKRPDFRSNGISSEGKTINLSISPRGLKALDAVGCREALLDIAVSMDRRVIHGAGGRQTTMHYGQPRWRNYAVARNDLNIMLLRKALCNDAVRVRFGMTCVGIRFETRTAALVDEIGQPEDQSYDLLVGADGAFSVVRENLVASGLVRCRSNELSSAYKELTLRPDGDDLCGSAIHVWPRRGFFLVALPNADKTFKCTLVLQRHGVPSFVDLRTDDEFIRFMRRNFPDIVSGFPALGEEFRRNPIGRITTASCDPLHWNDSVVLLGDAAHTVAPFLGQGINLGFEGCLVLNQLLTRHSDRAVALRQYSQERTENARAAAALSLTNYTELTHTETSPWIVAIRQLRNILHRRLARRLDPPAVVLVNFLDLTYSEAFQRLDKHRAPPLAPVAGDPSHQMATRIHDA